MRSSVIPERSASRQLNGSSPPQPINARWTKKIVRADAIKQLEIIAEAHGKTFSGSRFGKAHHRHGSSGDAPCKKA